MKTSWETLPLSEVVQLQRGHDLPSTSRVEGDVPVIGSFGVTGAHNETRYNGPGVAIGRSGASIGCATYVDGPFWPLNTCLFVTDFQGNDARWVYRMLDVTDFAAFNSGSAQPSLNRNFLRSIPITVPPVHEQRAIAEVLGALDDKIAANQLAASKSDDLIEAYYRWAISRSDAVDRPLLDVVDVTYGEAFKGAHFSEPGVGRPLIRIRDLKTSSPQVWTTESRAKATIIHPGDVLVGMDAEFRANWWLGEPGLLNQRVLRASAKHASRAFTRECLRRPLAALVGEKSATTVIHLNKSDLERSQVQVPDDESLAHFDAVAEPIRLARVALALENSKLAATRDELLPLLMAGKIRVKEAEKATEGVL